MNRDLVEILFRCNEWMYEGVVIVIVYWDPEMSEEEEIRKKKAYCWDKGDEFDK